MLNHKHISVFLALALLVVPPLAKVLGDEPDLFEERELDRKEYNELSETEKSSFKKIWIGGAWLYESGDPHKPRFGVYLFDRSRRVSFVHTPKIPLYLMYKQLKLNPTRI